MTLAEHLTAAWNYSVSIRHGEPDVGGCLADVPKDELLGKRKELLAVQQRCHVSRVHMAFIERVLASQP
jgi:hypothetical protein